MMTHEMAVKLAHGGFRTTRFEGIGNEVVKIVYSREPKMKPVAVRGRPRKRKAAK